MRRSEDLFERLPALEGADKHKTFTHLKHQRALFLITKSGYKQTAEIFKISVGKDAGVRPGAFALLV
jgi:hypothetical protein